MYPVIARMHPSIMDKPGALTRSQKPAVINKKQNAAMLRGTVNICAVAAVYPKALMMVGRDREKLDQHRWSAGVP